jgi:hypothetical protein
MGDARNALRAAPVVVALIQALDEWPPAKPLKRAYDPKDSIWQLATLADFGLTREDTGISEVAERVLAAQAEDGGFLHGGFDHTHSWDTRPYVCISHVMTYALASFGYTEDVRVQRAYAHILAWQRLDGGWHPNQLNLPGNARQDEPSCPFGTGNVLRALVARPELRTSLVAQRAARFLLTCWERRAEPYRPVGFGIGTTWDKLQYPFVQYQFLKTLDTLTQVPAVAGDPRLEEMRAQLREKRQPDGRWMAEAINKPYGEFDFGQKKAASPWITFLALRCLSR